MAVPASVDEFLDLVKKSGVADEKRLDACVLRARAAMPSEPAKFAGLLIQEGIITNFQAENILAGKWRRFTIGKYKVLERLGSGGFAQVYLCEHKLMRRRVAVKVLPVAKAKNCSALDRFKREAQVAAALDHPNIVHTYDIDQDADLHFIVLEFIDGANLQQIVGKSGPLSVPRAAYYIQQAACGLQHAYEHGLVHRDIKPGNILVDRQGTVKVLDMGLALDLASDEELTKKFDDGTLGTADYLSPEQAIDSHAVDIRTDIYSLGVTFYYLLTGKAPFEGVPLAQKLLAHQMKTVPPITGFRKDVPAGLLKVIDKMMAKNVEDRFPTPGHVFEALMPYAPAEVAPPSEAELPRLSPAAMGLAGSEAAQARQETPRPGKKSSVQVQPAALRTVAVPVKPAPPETPELAPWEQAAHDTDNPAGKDDTASESQLDLPRDKKPPKKSKRARIIVAALVSAFVILPICLTTAIFAALAIFFPDKPAPPPQVPPTLIVSRDPARKGIRRIQQALDSARLGATIELWDDTYDESVVIRGIPDAVTIQAAPGKQIVWRSGKSDTTSPIIRIDRSIDLTLKGKGITLDGGNDQKPNVNEPLMITSENPNLVVEDLQIRNFARSAVLIMNAAGKPNRPMRLQNLSVVAPTGDKLRGGIYFDANKDVVALPVNDYIEITGLQAAGMDADKVIRSRDNSVLGPNVNFPGR